RNRSHPPARRMAGGFANQRGAGLSMFAHSLRRFVTAVALFLPPTLRDSPFAHHSLKRGGLERGVIRTRSGRTVVTGPATEWLSCLPRLALVPHPAGLEAGLIHERAQSNSANRSISSTRWSWNCPTRPDRDCCRSRRGRTRIRVDVERP